MKNAYVFVNTCPDIELWVLELHLMEFCGLNPLALLLFGVSFWVSFFILIEDCNKESFRKLAWKKYSPNKLISD